MMNWSFGTIGDKRIARGGLEKYMSKNVMIQLLWNEFGTKL
jgi:hypothetical protein